MKRYSAILLLLLGALACEDKEIEKGTPDCILKIIQNTKKEPVGNPPAKIFTYTYNGKTVYYLPSRCCDIPSVLLDEQCNTICSPDGGLSGMGDGKCADFFTKRSNEKLIWQDDRK